MMALTLGEVLSLAACNRIVSSVRAHVEACKCQPLETPPSLVSLIRTTNLLERFHKEVRRKQRDIGMFHSEQGCKVVWYLLSMRENAKQRAALQSRL